MVRQTDLQTDAARRAAFVDLLEDHRKIVFKVAATYAWNAADRADLQQEIVAQLWSAFRRFDPARSFSTWMYRIALNVAISQVRRRHRPLEQAVAIDEAVHGIVDDLDERTEADARLQMLRSFTRELDRMNRALLLLYLEERSYREIAEVLGITETNVATKISRLKQRIHDYMIPEKTDERGEHDGTR
jgi:RNA polymerase sigma-70 factor (ECF subfamily)